MKKNILLLVLIFTFSQSWASNFNSLVDSTCSVTLTFVQGGYCLQADATGTAPFTYLWDNGDTGQTSCQNSPNGSNILCVTVTDADGCVATACGTLDPNNSNCSVSISQDSMIGTPGVQLTAEPSGTAPYTYMWSTGDLTQSIMVDQDGVYCVTITDDNGCQATSCTTVGNNNTPNCDVSIEPTPMGALGAIATGQAPFTYAWSTNETTEFIVPTTAGNYCVTITDASGCVADACYYFSGGGNNDTTCYVTVSQIQGAWCLEAMGYGTAPFTYTWENGDTGSTFCPSNSSGGTFCVTMVDANGCTSTACGTLGPNNQDSCFVNIIETNAGLLASSNPTGGTPISYLWSTGETTEMITPNGAGTYCVTITTANGCTAEDCLEVSFTGNIVGFVAISNDTLNMASSGTAYLIQYDPVEESLTAVDEVPFAQGYFHFDDVEAGEYLVKAALGPNAIGYDENMPTYFDHVLWWDEATTLNVAANTSYTIQINMVEGNNPGGPGFIGGLVSEGANFTGGADHRGDGDPLENITMLLLDENDNPISHTVTNENGEYEFDNLAWGTYKVFIEIAGIEHVMFIVTISPENPSANGINFIVDEDSATTVGIDDLVEEHNIAIYPNPASDYLKLQLTAKEQSEVIISLISIDGKTISEELVSLYPGVYTHSFDINELPTGLYYINIIDGKETISRKVIKE